MSLTARERFESVEPAGHSTKCLHVRDKEDVPHEAGLPDLYALDGGSVRELVLRGRKFTIKLPAGIELVGDPSAWDCALIVQPHTSPSDMRRAFAAIRLLSLEPLSEDEAEPELLEGGAVRLWLVPVDPEDPFAPEDRS